MDTQAIISQLHRFAQLADQAPDSYALSGIQSQAVEFLKGYIGTNNEFLKKIISVTPYDAGLSYHKQEIVSQLKSLISYVEAGLLRGLSPERQAQIDVVSDLLNQAQILIETKGVHAAAPAIICGVALEQFLRNWIEAEDVVINGSPSIDCYAKALRAGNFISKQDIKNITSWAGLRNHAAHGEWEEVSNKGTVRLMLMGINLFMQQYTNPKNQST